MAIQTTYGETMDAGRIGAIVDTNDKTLISRTAEVGSIGFGLPVVQGAADDGCWKAKTGDTAILGISVRDRSTLDDEFKVGESVRVMTKGVIWVTAAVAVAAGEPVTVVVASATFSNTGGVAIAGATYDSSGDAGSLVKVRLA
ncbi:hypothetical protein [uncultured Paraglaciecola sp.]|uniref:structural cement protein Gp24 n=1 Tax=uncultured Paraglaciecola sp. TaxID=1765024 RepID=UPI00262D581A|nr:hypothetical protein [uncultured Paraglaciecola sp.]